MQNSPILDIENVNHYFGHFHALHDINLSVNRGECMAIVGESGSGKTTMGNIILGILNPTSGLVKFNGDVLPVKRELGIKQKIQVVQQNPLSSLNPKRTIFQNVALPLHVHTHKTKAEQKEIVSNLLELMRIPVDFMNRYPPSLSGGQRQRVAIARALACEPEIVVLDEPTSALDVLVQVEVLKLLSEVQNRLNLTYIFITHDLGVVRNFADRVAVFQNGHIVEKDTVSHMFEVGPSHPYSRVLLSAIPTLSVHEETMKQTLFGEISENSVRKSTASI